MPYREGRLTKFLIVAFFALALGYAYYEGRALLFGPRITITTDESTTTERFITIEGHADRIVSLSMNGQAIPVTEEGEFKEPYLLAPGLNRIVLDAKDSYGGERQKVVEIVYTPPTGNELPIPPENASSTDAVPPATSSASSTQSASSTAP